MGIVNSSHSSSISTTFSFIPHPSREEPISSDDYSNDVMPVIDEVMSVNQKYSANRKMVPRTSTVTYGPIRIRKRHIAAPTLATGRRSKDDFTMGEDIRKREIRRLKNREAARNLKKQRDDIENSLLKQVTELESLQSRLLEEINNLSSYKERLNEEYHQTISASTLTPQTTCSASTNTRKRPRHISVDEDCKRAKEEARPPSPQWQLMFSI